MLRPRPHRRRVAGFTLIELLVVVGIIALLIGILVPVVARVRIAGQTTATASVIRAVDNACEVYHQDFQAYPGILPESMLGTGNTPQFLDSGGGLEDLEIDSGDNGYGTTTGGIYASEGDQLLDVTGTENMVLSLLGGLVRVSADEVVYDPSAVGRGPATLRLGQGTTSSAYLDLDSEQLSWSQGADGQTGRFSDVVGAAMDSPIPEVLDSFANPLPILYLRANTRVGRTAGVSGYGGGTGAVYALDQTIGYVGETDVPHYIGEGREPTDTNHETNGTFHGLQVAGDGDDTNGYTAFTISGSPVDGPFDADVYLSDPNAAGTARRGSKFILISPGPDRVYGTRDDVTNFGSLTGD